MLRAIDIALEQKADKKIITATTDAVPLGLYCHQDLNTLRRNLTWSRNLMMTMPHLQCQYPGFRRAVWQFHQANEKHTRSEWSHKERHTRPIKLGIPKHPPEIRQRKPLYSVQITKRSGFSAGPRKAKRSSLSNKALQNSYYISSTKTAYLHLQMAAICHHGQITSNLTMQNLATLVWILQDQHCQRSH